MKFKLFDVIVVGGGPAGLAVASELSERHKVLVVEKKVVGETDRFWFVPPDVLDEKTKPFSYGGVSRFLTKTYSMNGNDLIWRSKLFPRYPYIRDKDLLRHWAARIRSNCSLISDRCSYLDHCVDEEGVNVSTSSGTFRTRLLIDASGYDSTIVQKYGVDRSDFYWWSVYGAIGEHPCGIGAMQVGDYMMWQTFADADPGSLNDGKPVFEYEILDEKSSFSLILYLRKQRMDRETMKAEYYRIIRQQPSTADFHKLKVTSERWGWYPSGGLSQHIAQKRVAFIGDAACWTTPCGWGMTFILDNYRHFADTIGACLDNDTLDRESLLGASHYRIHDKYEILMNELATHFLANASTSELDRFIRLFQTDLDPLLCEKVFTLKISQEELMTVIKAVLKEFSVIELYRLLPAVGLTTLLKEMRYFAEDAIIDTLTKLFNDHPGTDSGFDFDDAPHCPVLKVIN